jgi:hypothetical protein
LTEQEKTEQADVFRHSRRHDMRFLSIYKTAESNTPPSPEFSRNR